MRNIVILLLCTCLTVLFFSGCTGKKKENKPVEDIREGFKLKKENVSATLKIPAELLPYEKAEIYSRIEAFVKNVLVDIGDRVRAGQTLAILEAPESASKYAEANSKYQETKARYMGSLDKYNRIKQASGEQGVIAPGELVNARNQMLADSAASVSARSTAEAYKQIEDYLTIRAPFNGTITSRSVDPGDMVGGAARKMLFRIERTDKLRLRVNVPESYVNSIPSEKDLSFTTDAALNRNFSAKLVRKSGSISQDTRTELWEYEYDNTTGDVKPGMYTTAQLQLNRSESSFVVPYSAIVTTLEKKFVVKVKNNRVEWVDVRQGISMDKAAEIYGNLNEGDTLLVKGSEELRPGTEVKIRMGNR